jgi:hypothetical protein
VIRRALWVAVLTAALTVGCAGAALAATGATQAKASRPAERGWGFKPALTGRTQLLDVVLVWAVLGAPVYLAARRRTLLDSRHRSDSHAPAPNSKTPHKGGMSR